MRGGTECKKRCREKWGDVGAERIPPLDGMVYINDDGTCITHLDQYEYDLLPCKRDHHPKVTQGPRPPGWSQALKAIEERAYGILKEGAREGIRLPEC